MAIQLHCPRCKSSSSIRVQYCKKCGCDLTKGEKRYRVVVKDYKGKRVTKVVSTLTTAKKLEAKLKTYALDRQLFNIHQDLFIDQAWNKYLVWAKENKKTWNDDLCRWELHVKPALSCKKLSSINAYDIQGVLDKMNVKRKYAPATIKQVLVLIRRLYNWCIQMDLYDGVNPASKVKIPKVNNEVIACLSIEEIKRLIEVLDTWRNKRVALLVRFALFTGLRRGEIFNLKWSAVNLNIGMITIEDPKGGIDQSIPISDEALKILLKARDLHSFQYNPYVFPNRHGQKRSYLGNTWKCIREKAQLSEDFRFHDLRHTYASYLASSGKVSMYTLQKLLTHKTSQMTQRYAHMFDQTLRDGANTMGEIICSQ